MNDGSLRGTLKIVARELRGKKYFRFNWSAVGQTPLITIYLKDNDKQGQLRNGEIYSSYRSLAQSVSTCKGDLIGNVLLLSAMKRDEGFQICVIGSSRPFLPKRNAPCIILNK